MFAAIPYDEHAHYAVAAEWWRQHNWPATPNASGLRSGVVVTFHEKPVAMAWVYRTDGPACWLHWLVSDRYADRRIRGAAVDHVIEACEMLAKGWGYTQLWACTSIRRSMKRYADHGYLECDKTTMFMKEL